MWRDDRRDQRQHEHGPGGDAHLLEQRTAREVGRTPQRHVTHQQTRGRELFEGDLDDGFFEGPFGASDGLRGDLSGLAGAVALGPDTARDRIQAMRAMRVQIVDDDLAVQLLDQDTVTASFERHATLPETLPDTLP